MQPLRIAVLGAGMIGREHIALVQDSADCQLVAVAVESAAPGELGKTFGVPCYTGYEALLEQESLDAVIVALPNALHLNAGLACIERGLPVLMEKPVADSLASGLALAEAFLEKVRVSAKKLGRESTRLEPFLQSLVVFFTASNVLAAFGRSAV